jgi:hypothetical protein
MKLMIILCLLVSASFAQASEVILTCTKTNFSDLKKIEITTSDKSPNEMIVTETNASGVKTVYSRQMTSRDNLDIELSSWNGYSRRLYNDGYGWSIEHHDECSGGVGTATCF